MTAVASPPSLQPLPRLGWNSSGSGSSQGGLDSMSTAEVTRMLARKSPQRTNSSSTTSSTTSDSSEASDNTINNNKDPKVRPPRGQGGEWMNARSAPPWTPPDTPEAASPSDTLNGKPPAVSQVLPAPLTQPPMAALHQPPPVVPSQKNMQQHQTNGIRPAPSPTQTLDPPAVLALLPMNGTFERKQINVPLFPDILRIGRQTNAKTVPTPLNGYFDSKVLSRQHAEVWADRNGKIWIRDVKSSNGTFVNGMRLSPESRDSEPHELRENDMLELGIDIVSEDQKSIVHHKVSAKVEHAGIHVNTSSVLDLNIGDIDPGSGGGMLGQLFPQQIPIRGRLGNNSVAVMSNGRMMNQNMGGNMPGPGVQRHMNNWLHPVSIEQVVKRLGNELKQAKQQAVDLHRTSDFFNAVLTAQPGQEMPKPPSSSLPPPPQTNGIASPKRVDPMSPFSEPPAPPPQQPLPEKPDMPRSIHGEDSLLASLKRSDTEKPLLALLTTSPIKSSLSKVSPLKADVSSSQILSLAEALAATRRELENQGSRVKHLEELLKQERRARESAEERARHLLERTTSSGISGSVDTAAETLLQDTPTPESTTTFEVLPESEEVASEKALPTAETQADPSSEHDSDVQASNPALIHDKLALVLAEMSQVKLEMEKYRSRAEVAESERNNLADMVERIRSEEQETSHTINNVKPRRTSTAIAEPTSYTIANGSANSSSPEHQSDEHSSGLANGSVAEAHPERQIELLQSAVAKVFAGSAQQDERLLQSAPYASILGVVLLGVGIMAYLNGMSKTEG